MGFYHSIVIQAPIDDVWKTIGDFHDLSWADPVLTKLQPVGDAPGDAVGAKRILNDQYHETLLMRDAARFTFSYATENLPEEFLNTKVTDYISTIRLLPVTSANATFVEWTATFESDQPDAVVELGNPIYEALLQLLKKRFER